MTPLFPISQLPRTSGRRAWLEDGTEIAVFDLGDRIVAVDNVCPHQRFPLLHEGEVTEGVVSCPMHGWEFDLLTGECRFGGNARLRTWRVEVIDGMVCVDERSGEEEQPAWME